MNKKTAALAILPPMAMSGSRGTSNGWFSMKASTNSSATIDIYDEIGGCGISAKEFANQLKALGNVHEIQLNIHSPGGDVFDGMAIYNLLSSHPATINVRIDGLAASMASTIAMVGNTITMPENSMMMVHKPWGIQGGNAEQMREYAELLDKVENTLLSAYVKKTGLPEEKVSAYLEAETWFSAKECVELGFADVLDEPFEAVASLTSNRVKDFQNMPQSAKNLFEPQANAGRQTPASAESQRQNGIRSLFAHFGNGRFQNICSELISDKSITVEMARERILKELGAGTEPTNTASAAPYIFADNGNITNDAIKQSLTARIGLEKQEKDNPYKHSSLFELARASLRDNGVSTFGAGSRRNIVGLAFTHTGSDFGHLLVDVAEKSMLKGWEEAPETFEQWTQKGTLTNFKEGRRVGLHGFAPLREVKEGAEYKYVTVDDYGEPIILATYGDIFSITRQAIINDDLSILSTIPRGMGAAARRTVGDLVYAVLTNNADMNDGKPLFSNEHNNLINQPVGQEGIGRGRYNMRMQKDSKGNVLNIQPSHMIVPADLESKAIIALKSLSLESASNTGVVNPVHEISKLVVEPRLGDDSATAWYMASNNQTIEVAYLDGIDTPYIEQQEGFTVDGVATKVRIDAGVAPLDYRGMLKSTGVTESQSN